MTLSAKLSVAGPALACALLLTSAQAAAQPPTDAAKPETASAAKTEQARQLSDQGLEHFQRGEYDQAIAAFRASYELTPVPLLIFNMAQAYRKKADCAQALELYRRYLQEDPNTQHRTKVEARIKEMEECAPRSSEPTKPSASEPQSSSSAEQRKGSDEKRTGVQVAPIPPKQAAHESDGKTLRTAGLITGGAGLVTVGAGVFFTLEALRLKNELQDIRDAEWDPDKDDRRKLFVIATVVSYSVGGAALVTGGVLYYLGVQKRNSDSTVAVSAAPGGATIQWTHAF